MTIKEITVKWKRSVLRKRQIFTIKASLKEYTCTQNYSYLEKKRLKTSYSTIISKNHFLYNQVHNSSIRELRKLIGWNEYTCIEYSLQLNVLIDSVDITIHRIYIRINCKCNIFFKKFNFILVSPRINYCISIRGKAFHSS